MKVINGKKVNITRAGYIYVNGKKVAGPKTPFSCPGIEGLDEEIKEYAREWAFRNYRMVNR